MNSEYDLDFGTHSRLESAILGELNDRVVFDDVTGPPTGWSGDGCHLRDLRRERSIWQCHHRLEPRTYPVNDRLMNPQFDLHLRKVRHQKKNLIFPHRGAIGDVWRRLPGCR